MNTHLNWHVVGLLTLVGLVCQAQTKPTALLVTYVEGPVAYRSSTQMSWQPISNRRAVTLYPSYELRLAPQAVLALAQPGREAVVIRNQLGIVKLSTLLQKPHSEVATVLGTYFQFLWRNLTHKHESIDTYAQGYMKRKGVVSRGEGCTPPLMLTPDYGAAIVGDSAVRFSWKTEPGTLGYTFAIYDNYDDKANRLYQTTTTDTTLLFALDKPFLEKAVIYYWTVAPTKKPNCARYTFHISKSDVFQQLEAKIATLQQQLGTDVALAAFVKATLYEGSHFYSEAYRAYFEAHRLSPKNSLYRDGFALFLARRGLVRQANGVLAQ